MKFYVLIMLGFLAACEEDQQVSIELRDPVEAIPLWIDDSCPDRVVEATIDAVDALEDLFGQQMIEIIGFTFVESHDHFHSGAGSNTLVCYSEETPRVEDWAGQTWLGDSVDIYLFRYDPDSYRHIYRLVLHELSHYIGLPSHPDDCNGITSEAGTKWEFQQCDVDYFCEFFDCV